MKYKIKDILKETDESAIAEVEKQFKKIEDNFRNDKFNFRKMKFNDEHCNWVKKYLKFKGYGYVSKKIKNNMDSIELFNLFIDSNLLTKPKIEIQTDLDENIVYVKDFGYSEEYNIKYSTKVGVPFKVYSFTSKENNYVSCSLKNNTLKIFVKIPEKTEVDLQETIVVYTSLGIREIHYSIICNEEDNMNIDLIDFQEFINLVKDTPIKAKNIFDKKEFRQWLNKKNYLAQLITYDEAEKLSELYNDKYSSKFLCFCQLNNIYINTDYSDEIKQEVTEEDVSIQIMDEQIIEDSIDEAVVEEETKIDVDVESENINTVHDNNHNVINKIKSFFSRRGK